MENLAEDRLAGTRLVDQATFDSNQTTTTKETLAKQMPENEQITANMNLSCAKATASSSMPPTVYGELSILGYNGCVPGTERTNRRHRSKFLLCKRSTANGIKKSCHYRVKQPQETKAIQDKDLHTISYTISRSQTIIVEHRQDENTDMFQIGRSSEAPIDFVVTDTLTANGVSEINSSKHSESSSAAHQQQIMAGDMLGMSRFHRQLAKVGESFLQFHANTPQAHNYILNYAQGALLNYQDTNAVLNLSPIMLEHFRAHDQAAVLQQALSSHQAYLASHSGGAGMSVGLGGSSSHNSHQQSSHSSSRQNNHHHHHHHHQHQSTNPGPNDKNEHSSSRHNAPCKRSHGTTQSTISRFACRIIVDRNPPHTARIYAAGFDSSKNIFLGEKATKWEQNESIDGLTTNGVLIKHPKRKGMSQDASLLNATSQSFAKATSDNSRYLNSDDEAKQVSHDHEISTNEEFNECSNTDITVNQSVSPSVLNDSNNNSKKPNSKTDGGKKQKDSCEGVWREVSVDGGIYAIRESRSAAQKGIRIEDETNILQDGTLIDLCGATLLWRSVDGFRSAPTKKTLEEKLDTLNATRPQCPVGLNTLVIPRKPIMPFSQRGGHVKNHEKSGHQPYVYLKCGHVQGYHDWGTTDKANQRTCPICFSVGSVAKLSMGLEPSFYVDSGDLTHAFSPCGHMTSESTARYWSSIKIPHGTHFFHAICPFCASPLSTTEPAYTKLIFQDDLD